MQTDSKEMYKDLYNARAQLLCFPLNHVLLAVVDRGLLELPMSKKTVQSKYCTASIAQAILK